MCKIGTVFSPSLFDDYRSFSEDYFVVVVDIFRATSCFCTALHHGAKAIIPVADLKELEKLKHSGLLAAAERGGKKVDFADFGNDPHEFMVDAIFEKEIAYSTTNGTQALEKAMNSNSNQILVASFLNLSAIVNYICQQQKDVLILCSGWLNRFSYEDAFFAGALSDNLMMNGFITSDDATKTASTLWQSGKSDSIKTLEKNSSHLHRLLRLGITNTLPYVLQTDACPVVPMMKNGKLIALHEKVINNSII